MKVLCIISTGYVAGGAENLVAKINCYLSSKGYCVKTLSSDLGPGKEHFNDYVFKSINSANPFTLLLFLFNPFSFFVTRKVLKEFKPDIVHLHTMHQVTPSVLFLLKKYPTVMTLHGPETFVSKLMLWCMKPPYLNYFYDKNKLNVMGKLSLIFNHIQRMIYMLALHNVDLFIAPSKFLENAAKSDVSPVIHLPNFTDMKEFYELKNSYNLLFVGRLEKVKGIEALIEAMAFIIKMFPQTTLTVIGEGQNKENLLNLSKDLHLEKHIHFVGWVKDKGLDIYYKKASIVVFPSVGPEIFGLVILEAMSAGRPVIGTSVGGIPEIITDGVNGYLVEPGSAEQIAEKVIKLFSDEDLLKEFGKNARKQAEEYTIEKYAKNIEKIYKDLLYKYKLNN